MGPCVTLAQAARTYSGVGDVAEDLEDETFINGLPFIHIS